MKVLFVLGAILALAAAKEIGIRHYDGYQVLSVKATTKEQFNVLKDLVLNDDLDFWKGPKLNDFSDIMVNPEQVGLLKTIFQLQGMEFSTKIADVGVLIAEEKVEMNARSTRMDWTSYHTYAELEAWITSEVASSSVSTVMTIGQSTEGRGLHMVKVSTGNSANKKAIFLDANLHAREWISGAVGSYILNELTTKPDTYSELLDAFDFYIVPMANPDGYEFSRTNDRMWRKTRSINSGSTCRGCDPNRNFAFHFGGESTSSSPCSDLFKGPSAFSEPETAALRDAIKGIQAEQELFAYFTLHSYGQLWLLSWGYTQGVYPPDYAELLDWGRESIAALEAVSGTSYVTGQGADMLYGVGGASDDWAKSEGAKYVATIELRDEGRYGFELPASQIIATAQETWTGIQLIGQRLKKAHNL